MPQFTTKMLVLPSGLYDSNKPLYPFPEDGKLSQRTRKMSTQLINMTCLEVIVFILKLATVSSC